MMRPQTAPSSDILIGYNSNHDDENEGIWGTGNDKKSYYSERPGTVGGGSRGLAEKRDRRRKSNNNKTKKKRKKKRSSSRYEDEEDYEGLVFGGASDMLANLKVRKGKFVKESKILPKNRRGKHARGSVAIPPEKALEERQSAVDKLSKKTDNLEIKFIKQTRQIESLRKQIIEEKKERKRMGGVKAFNIQQANVAKQIRILENRLNKLNIRSCEVEAENTRLVTSINAGRKERTTFERSYKKLQREFKAKQQAMAKMLEQSNRAYEGRKEALRKLEELKSTAEKEEEEFAKEYLELGNLVAEQAQMTSYVQRSAMKRREKEIEEKIANGNLDPNEEENLKSKLNQLAQGLQKQEETISSTAKSMQSYEEAFNKLYEFAGIRDMNEIVDQFVRNEDSNFALFNHIQFINKETEKDEENLRRLQDDMDKYKKELGQNEGNRERIVSELGVRLEKYKDQAEDLNRHIENNEHILEGIAQATENLFFRIGCHEMLEGFRVDPSELAVSISPKSRKTMSPTAVENLGSSRRGMKAKGDHGRASPSSPNPAVESPTTPPNRKHRTMPKEGLKRDRKTVDTRPTRQSTTVSPLALRLGTQVTEQNIMLYLGVVEQRTNEIIQSYRKDAIAKGTFTFKGSEKLSSTGLPIPNHPKGSHKISILAPACGGGSEDDTSKDRGMKDFAQDEKDEVERPLSSQQLREMTMRENQPMLQSQGSSRSSFMIN